MTERNISPIVRERLVTTTVYDKFTLDEFKQTFLQLKPKELYCLPYSSTTPLLIITEISEEGIHCSCKALADKTTKFSDWTKLYRELSHMGFETIRFEKISN